MTFENLEDPTQWFIIGAVGIFVFIITGVTAAKKGYFDKDDNVEYDPNNRGWEWQYEDIGAHENENMSKHDKSTGVTKRKRKYKKKSHKNRK